MSAPTVRLTEATELVRSVASLLCSGAGHRVAAGASCPSCTADAIILLDDVQAILHERHGLSLVARTSP